MQDNVSWRSISVSQSYIPAEPPITQIQDDITIHEFD